MIPWAGMTLAARFLLAGALAVTPGCAAMNYGAVAVERGLEAGSMALDVAVDARITYCREKNLPSELSRAACVSGVMKADAAAEKAMTAAVVALRLYWTAAAANDRAGKREAVVALAKAVADMPPEYFEGVQKMARRMVGR